MPTAISRLLKGNFALSVACAAQPRNHIIKAVADSDSAVPESDETNNQKEVTFGMGFPDLLVDNITWSPASPNTGQTVTFTVTVKNQGTGNAGSSYVYYYIDGSNVANDYIASVAAGGISSQTFTWSAQTGTHTVKAVADYNGSVPESYETNNEKEVSVSIS